MGAGEYVATKSQNEVMTGEIKLEKEHVEHRLEEEMEELDDLLDKIGITGDIITSTHSGLRDELRDFYRENPDALLKIMVALEFGVIEEEVRSPFMAGVFSSTLFVFGSLPSVLPFVFSGDRPTVGLVVAASLTMGALLLVGAIKTWATRGKCIVAAFENLLIAGVGGALAYGVGVFFDKIIR